jgi:hypothetical protein
MPSDFRPLPHEHWQAGDALHCPPRIRTFGFEHECFSATQVSEQYFEDTVSRILFAFGVDGDRTVEEEHAAHEFGRGLRAQAMWIEQSQFSRELFYSRAGLAKHDHGSGSTEKLSEVHAVMGEGLAEPGPVVPRTRAAVVFSQRAIAGKMTVATGSATAQSTIAPADRTISVKIDFIFFLGLMSTASI